MVQGNNIIKMTKKMLAYDLQDVSVYQVAGVGGLSRLVKHLRCLKERCILARLALI